MNNFVVEPLKRDDVRAVIRHQNQNSSRVPMAFVKWWGEGLWEQHGQKLSEFNKYPEDVVVIGFPCPPNTPRDDGFYWRLPTPEQRSSDTKIGHDSNCSLPNWKYLDDFVNNLPNTEAEGLFDEAVKQAEQARKEGRYVLLHHWGLMYERIWGFRGMENLLFDYIENPDEIHALHKAVADTEEKLLRRAIKEVNPDGYMHSDDLGGQQALMMGPIHFREFIKPYYKQIWSAARENDVDVWLHTCGHITEIIGDLIECGLSVLHPIQKGTMEWNKIAADWKGKIAFWVGMDVQDTLINATPEQVRAEVRLMRDTFNSPTGGMLYASGNGIVGGTPFENIDAYLDECCKG